MSFFREFFEFQDTIDSFVKNIIGYIILGIYSGYSREIMCSYIGLCPSECEYVRVRSVCMVLRLDVLELIEEARWKYGIVNSPKVF